jgi:peroxiredoxin
MQEGTANLVRGVLLLAFSGLALYGVAPVPRASPELTLVDPSGNELLLSSFRGRVVLLEFLLTNCPHCSRVAQTIGQIQRDFDLKGFQAIGVAIENGIRAQAITDFAQDLKIAFPVRYAPSDKVDSFLGRVGTERFQVPQLVLIDREGVIRAQSRPVGENLLESADYLRKSIEALLIEGGPTTNSARISRVWVNSAISSIAVLVLFAGFLIWIKEKRRGLR